MSAPFILVKSHKSVGIAILLTILFGPIGLFYASVFGGVVMTLTPFVLGALMLVGMFSENTSLFEWSFMLLIFFGLTFWLICLIWAVVGVNNYNNKINQALKRQGDDWLRSKEGKSIDLELISQNVHESRDNLLPGIQRDGSLHVEDWLNKNPGKTINDYFTKFKN